MPYIKKERRKEINSGVTPADVGELNYAITKMVDQYIIENGGLRYARINDAIGALECAKMELYRRIAVPYEDGKIESDGDVYESNA